MARKYGFIDKNGKVVIELQYDYVGHFSEGLAQVKKDSKEPDILIKLFGDELGESDELINDYYGRFIEEIEDTDDIKVFAETLTEELRDDYGGKLSEDERSKFHYALMFNSMTIAYKRMLKQLIKDGDQEEEDWDEDDLDITKGLVSNEHYTKMLEGLDVHAGAEVKMASKYGFIDKSGKVVIEPQFDHAHAERKRRRQNSSHIP